MSKQESISSYLRLEETLTTSFQLSDQKFTIRSAPANIFDAFISQVVENIKNVDRQKWDLHERWRIINYCLSNGVLHLTSGEAGQLLEYVPDDEPEVEGDKSSETASEAIGA